MAKEKEILRMHFEGHSQRDICAALKCGHTRVSKLIAATRKDGVAREATNAEDASTVLPVVPPKAQPEAGYAMPDFDRLTAELMKPGVTRKLLWHEYCTDISNGSLAPYQYSQFCKLFDEHLTATKVTYRIKHEPGKRMFVDWAGTTGHITDPITGEVRSASIFVACLPYSALIYAEGFMDMKQASWTLGHIHAFERIGGVPPIVVPDNTKTAVTRSPAYTVLINASYDELATHYGFAVIPARPRKPNDKALVENAVNIVERSVLAALRGRTFFALDELNDAIAEKVDQINAAPFQRRPGTRLEIFDEEERPLLRPLPLTRFELATYRTAKVAPDSHVQVETMRYSVPYRLVGKTCDIRLTPDRIEVMHGGRRVADHGRLYGRKGQYSTNAEHMPPNHAAYDAKWTPERYQRWADGVGPGARKLVDRVLSGKRIVEQTFVPCMNILGLAKKGRRELLEEACLSLAESPVTPTYSLVKNTMEAIKAKKNLDAATAPRRSDMKEDTLGDAGCVRGSDYYRSGEDDDDDI